MLRLNITTSDQSEKKAGSSSCVRVNGLVEIGATLAIDEEGKPVWKNDPYLQTKYALEKADKLLFEAGAFIKDVIRTRMYVTDISSLDDYMLAHKEMFCSIKPCLSIIEVSSLSVPGMMVAVELTAVVPDFF